ncbi:MMPL family transporter [Nocardioides sp. GY 10113]|uniref:MMPL family transporter n=1 Tax=Nocardioides sp. GY 10113 TaxID=2569761 RepID=UPI001458284A|nr:MMPL family transporter [Nocardioides sp. GY 10113]
MTGGSPDPGAGREAPGREGGRAARAFARSVVRARWAILALWACALVGLTLAPAADRPGGSGLRGVLSADTPAVQTEIRSVEIFGFPLSSRTVVVQRDADGLSPYAHARTVVRAAAVDRGKAGDVAPIRGALPLTNARGLFPGARESGTTALTYLLFGPGTSLGARTRAAHRYADRFFTERDHVVGVTGSAPARIAQGSIIRSSLPTVELATLLAIALIVAASFRSLVAPLVTAGTAATAYVVTLHVSGYVAALLDLPSPDELEPVVVALLLGVVTDYVVFFCSALRDLGPGRRSTAAGRDVAARAIARSAPIVGVAGLAVAAGTAALLAAESPFFRTLGPALALTVLVGLLVAITLVPALLAVLGDRIFWPGRRASGRRPPASVWASRWARLVRVRRPRWPRRAVESIAGSRRVAGAVLGGCVTILLLASAPLLRLDLGVSFVDTLPAREPVREAASAAQAGFAEGILSPTVVLLEGKGIGRRHEALTALGTALERQPGVAGVLGPGAMPVRAEAGVLVARDGDAARYLVVLDSDPGGADAVHDIDRLSDRLPALAARAGLRGATASLGGDTATASYLVHQTQDDLIRIALAALAANLVMLLVFLRSVLASVLLLGSSLLSLGATLTVTGAVFDVLAPGQGLTFYVPFAAAVLLLAFGSDYNIFTVGHVWEAAHGRSVRHALLAALPSALSAVAVAGLALGTSFGLLGLVPLLPFRQLAFAVALGITLDVFVVRLLMVPALLTVLGPAAAWPSNRFVRPTERRTTVDP